MRSVAPSTSEPSPPGSTPSLPGRLARTGLAGALVAGLVLSGAPLCPVAFFTGFPCPGCGLSRAGVSLLQGDLPAAFAASPLSPVVVPFFVLLVVRSVALYLKGGDASPPAWVTRGAIGLWAGLIVVWGLRYAGFFGGPVPVRSLWG